VEGAVEKATKSDVRTGQFTPGIPVRTHGSTQLLPRQCLRAARALLKKCQDLLEGHHEGPAWLEYRLFYPEPTIFRSFEFYDIIMLRSHSVYLALPRDQAFHPETLLHHPGRIVIGHNRERFQMKIAGLA